MNQGLSQSAGLGASQGVVQGSGAASQVGSGLNQSAGMNPNTGMGLNQGLGQNPGVQGSGVSQAGNLGLGGVRTSQNAMRQPVPSLADRRNFADSTSAQLDLLEMQIGALKRTPGIRGVRGLQRSNMLNAHLRERLSAARDALRTMRLAGTAPTWDLAQSALRTRMSELSDALTQASFEITRR